MTQDTRARSHYQDGGSGYQVVPQAGYRDFPFTGWLVKRKIHERLELGAEIFAHGREGFATPQTEASATIDLGGYYHFKRNPNEQFLFCYGHSVAGQTENYAYAGMYVLDLGERLKDAFRRQCVATATDEPKRI
ncbi:MAG: hypothetical protein KGL37_12065 [Acidobacteriota bacterium]|nr:hypothetical protein [Acidobacteriota bacterium]